MIRTSNRMNRRQFGRAAVPQIFGRSEPEQFIDETVRHGRLSPGQKLGSGRDERGSVTSVVASGFGLSVHVRSAYDAS